MPLTIQITLKGMLVTSISEDGKLCTVGILKEPPPAHLLTMIWSKTVPGHTTPPVTLQNDQNLVLAVRHPTEFVVFKDEKPVDRMDPQHPNPESMKWLVDLDELYGSAAIGLRREAFFPTLTFNSGRIYTKEISENMLQIHRGNFSGFDKFGYVGVRIGIDVLVDAGDSVVLTSGSSPLLDTAAEPGSTGILEITQDAPTHSAIVTDANSYYKGVGTTIDPEKRILFLSIGKNLPAPPPKAAADIPAGPEAACFTAYMGKTRF